MLISLTHFLHHKTSENSFKRPHGLLNSHVPGMQVIVDEHSSTIFTAGHPAASGGTVTTET